MEITDGERRYMHCQRRATAGGGCRMGAVQVEEIGHGYLAERALLPALPTEEDFPYAIRSVTEIASQNGFDLHRR